MHTSVVGIFYYYYYCFSKVRDIPARWFWNSLSGYRKIADTFLFFFGIDGAYTSPRMTMFFCLLLFLAHVLLLTSFMCYEIMMMKRIELRFQLAG